MLSLISASFWETQHSSTKSCLSWKPEHQNYCSILISETTTAHLQNHQKIPSCSKTVILAALKCIYWCVWCRSAPAHMMSEALQSVPGCTSIWETPSSSHAQRVPKDVNSHHSLPSNPSRAPAGDTAREALTLRQKSTSKFSFSYIKYCSGSDEYQAPVKHFCITVQQVIFPSL